MADQSLSVLIVEDEPVSALQTMELVTTHPNLEPAGIARDGNQAIELINNNDYDLVFLDIGIPGPTGLELCMRVEHMPLTIFTTATREHALQAFELGVVDYLLKPIDQDRFSTAVERALARFGSGEGTQAGSDAIGIFVRSGENNYFLTFDEIIYVESRGKQSVVFTRRGEILAKHLILDLEKKLPPGGFKRIHRRFIVNMKYISYIEFFVGGNHIAYMKDSEVTTLPIGRKYLPNLKEMMPASPGAKR